MESNNFDYLKQFPIDFLHQIEDILNDAEKFSELANLLEKSGLTFESTIYKKQFTIQTKAELVDLKDYLKKILIPA